MKQDFRQQHRKKPSLKQSVFFKKYYDQEKKKKIGIASFGPVGLHPGSDQYGFITSTPKKGWANTNFLKLFRESIDLPLIFETDVNGAAYGEYCWGAARGIENFIYITIGTGIGAGAMISGKMVHGLVHPEMGHMLRPVDKEDLKYCNCLYHPNCLEGMASGPAIERRWGQPAKELPPAHPAWEIEAHYLADRKSVV